MTATTQPGITLEEQIERIQSRLELEREMHIYDPMIADVAMYSAILASQ